MSEQLVYDPFTGRAFAYSGWDSVTYRKDFPTSTWFFDPWTGTRRVDRFVEEDPYGYSILPPKTKGMVKVTCPFCGQSFDATAEVFSVSYCPNPKCAVSNGNVAKKARPEKGKIKCTICGEYYAGSHCRNMQCLIPLRLYDKKDASQFLTKAAEIMAERGKQYDSPEGERSMSRAVAAFNAITGKVLSESEGWLLMLCLKNVRLFQREGFHADSAEDAIAYAALLAEGKQGERKP